MILQYLFLWISTSPSDFILQTFSILVEAHLAIRFNFSCLGPRLSFYLALIKCKHEQSGWARTRTTRRHFSLDKDDVLTRSKVMVRTRMRDLSKKFRTENLSTSLCNVLRPYEAHCPCAAKRIFLHSFLRS